MTHKSSSANDTVYIGVHTSLDGKSCRLLHFTNHLKTRKSIILLFIRLCFSSCFYTGYLVDLLACTFRSPFVRISPREESRGHVGQLGAAKKCTQWPLEEFSTYSTSASANIPQLSYHTTALTIELSECTALKRSVLGSTSCWQNA